MRWDYFIKSYDSDAENRKSEKMTYTTSSGGRYTGATPPSGATSLGLLYPRAGTLGGCTSHNALIAITPHNSDWTYIQNVTGDAAVSAFPVTSTRAMTNVYCAVGSIGHAQVPYPAREELLRRKRHIRSRLQRLVRHFARRPVSRHRRRQDAADGHRCRQCPGPEHHDLEHQHC